MRDLTSFRQGPILSVGPLLQVLPPAARYILRGAEAAHAAAEGALGVEIPAIACRAASEGERAALWLGPDEWLLIGPLAEGTALEATLGAALKELPHSLVDVSHRQIGLCVSGRQAALLLAAGCPLDLDESAFPVGMCTRTMLAKAEVVLWRPAREVFRVEVWRSFAAYLTQYLAESARGMI
jgi:sarcosine oxidase subunit gamma